MKPWLSTDLQQLISIRPTMAPFGWKRDAERLKIIDSGKLQLFVGHTNNAYSILNYEWW